MKKYLTLLPLLLVLSSLSAQKDSTQHLRTSVHVHVARMLQTTENLPSNDMFPLKNGFQFGITPALTYKGFGLGLQLHYGHLKADDSENLLTGTGESLTADGFWTYFSIAPAIVLQSRLNRKVFHSFTATVGGGSTFYKSPRWRFEGDGSFWGTFPERSTGMTAFASMDFGFKLQENFIVTLGPSFSFQTADIDLTRTGFNLSSPRTDYMSPQNYLLGFRIGVLQEY